MLNADISRTQWLILILLSLFMGWRPLQGLEPLRDCGVAFTMHTCQNAN